MRHMKAGAVFGAYLFMCVTWRIQALDVDYQAVVPLDDGVGSLHSPGSLGLNSPAITAPTMSSVHVAPASAPGPAKAPSSPLLGADADSIPIDMGPSLLSCKDLHRHCEAWAALCECQSNPSFMRHECRMSCGACCSDAKAECASWAVQGECDSNPVYMRAHCKRSCDVCCHNRHDRVKCAAWSKTADSCEANAIFMGTRCTESCGMW